MALPGIANENEFYSAHYLDAILTEDMKQVSKRWQAAATLKDGDGDGDEDSTAGKSPDRALGSLRKDYFSLQDRMARADDDEKLALQREFFQTLLPILGYTWQPQVKALDDETLIPIVAEVARSNGLPQLWVLEGFNPTGEPTDVLSLPALDPQVLQERWDLGTTDPLLGGVPVGRGGSASAKDKPTPSPSQEGKDDTTLEDLLDPIFALENPPRWVILISIDQIVLIDRHKWAASRLLRFDLQELLNERDPSALLAAATLLHREHTCPTEGSSLLDDLDENSHRHAYSVSEDLKFALRQAIELLGNEVIYYRKEVAKKRVYSTADQKAEGSGKLTPTSSRSNACAGSIGCCLCFTSRRGLSWATFPWGRMCTARAIVWRLCATWSRRSLSPRWMKTAPLSIAPFAACLPCCGKATLSKKKSSANSTSRTHPPIHPSTPKALSTTPFACLRSRATCSTRPARRC